MIHGSQVIEKKHRAWLKTDRDHHIVDDTSRAMPSDPWRGGSLLRNACSNPGRRGCLEVTVPA